MRDLQRVSGEPVLSGSAGSVKKRPWGGPRKGRGLALGLLVLCALLLTAVAPVGAQVAIQAPVAAPPQRENLPPLVKQAQRFLAQRSLTPGTARLRGTGRSVAVPAGVRPMATAPSQPAPAATWTALGPSAVLTPSFGLVTGRVSALALDPSDSTGNTLYVGTTGGGVWRSENAGASASAVAFIPLTDAVQALSGAADASISIGALTVQPGGTGVILAGTGDPNDLLDSYYGAGILRSTDGGISWSLIAGTLDEETGLSGQDFSFAGEAFAGFAWSTVQPQVVVAAVSQAYEGTLVNADRLKQSYEGLYYSADSGATWHLATINDLNGEAVQGPLAKFALPDGNAATSVVWNPVRGLFVAAVRFHGYYQSPDGITWTQMAAQPGSGLTAALCPTNSGSTGSIACPIFRGTLAVNPETGDTFAWTVDLNGQDQGVWQDQCAVSSGRCGNPGITFSQELNTAALETNSNLGPATIENGAYTLALAAVPAALGQGEDTLVLAGANDLWKCSLAMGCVWRNTTNATTCISARVAAYQHALAWNAANPQQMFIGNDSGLWSSTDGIGETGQVCAATDASHFENLNGNLGSLAEVVSMSETGSTPYTMMAGLGANGTAGVKNTTGPVTDWPQILSGEDGAVVIDPRNSANWYVNDADGVSIYLCAQPGDCTPSAFGTSPAVNDSDVGGDGYTMSSPAPFLVDPLDGTQLLIGTCRVWRGPADGSGWTGSNAISPVLDSGATGVSCNGDALIRSMAAAAPPAGGGEVVYVGMYGSLNGGANLAGHVLSANFNPSNQALPVWTDLTLNPVTNNSSAMNTYGLDISSILIDPHDPSGQTIYVTVEGVPQVGELPQLVYGSTDGGAHWANLTNSLPAAPANSVAVDPQSAGTVYVATDAGVYFTTQIANCAKASSDCWTVFGSGLPGAPVVQLSASPGKAPVQVLVAGTYGRGIWQTPLWSAGTALTTASVNPGSLTFGSQVFGTNSSAQTVTLTNTGSLALTPTGVVPSGDFSETDNCQGATVAVGGSCAIEVAFTPNATGSRTGQLTVSANVYGGQLTVSLSGVGIPAGTVNLTPATVDFGQVEVGTTSAPLAVAAGNSGGAAVPIASVTISSPFVIASNSCGTSALAANTDCQVLVEFAPTQAGAVAGTLTFNDGAGTQTVLLNGSGAAPPTDSLPATSMSFPATVTGQISAAQGVLLSNTGDLTLTGISITARGAFQTFNNCGAQLAGHASCTISVQFAPVQPGSQTGTLTVSDALRMQTVALSGTGVSPPTLSVNPASLSFGALNPGQTSTAQTVTITNSNSFAASGLTVSAASQFSLTQNTCPASLAAGASCTVSVIFTPAAYGMFMGTVSVSSTSVAIPPAVALTGMGFDFAVAAASSTSQTVAGGQTATYTLSITPVWISSSDFSPGGTFTYQCGTLPADAACAPASSQVSAGASGNLTVAISTGSPVASRSIGPAVWRVVPLACGLLVLPLALWRRRKALMIAALLAFLAGGVASCTSAGGNLAALTGSAKTSGSTPAGTYAIPVTVSSGGVSHAITVMLTID